MHEADPSDQIGELIRYGTIASVDLATAKCTVRIGDIVTQPIRWLHGAAGGTTGTAIWSPPAVGEQVVLLAPEGDIAAAIALRGVHSVDKPPAGNAARVLIDFADGAVIAYDPESHTLDVTLPDGATANIVAKTLTLTGDLKVTGTITADTDVIAAGKSLKSHRHTGVQAGSVQTGAPA